MTLLAWAFYDWANNAFATVILTFVFASYFTRQVAPDPVTGTELWGYTLAGAGLAVSVIGPLLGPRSTRAAAASPGSSSSPWSASRPPEPCGSCGRPRSGSSPPWPSSGVGAAALSGLDDRLGPKPTIAIALVGLSVLTTGVLVAASPAQFWTAALALAFFVGPVNAASRSYLSRAAPEKLRNELFGLYALSGKVVSFLGPLLIGWVAGQAGSQRAGMAVVVVLFLAGLLLLLRVPRVAEVQGRT